MKIALFPSAYHPHFGGVEELARQLAKRLHVVGHFPAVYTNRWPKDLSAYEMVEGVPVHRWVFRVPEREWRQMVTSLLFTRMTLQRVCVQIKKQGAEILHVQCVSSNSYYAVRARRRLNIPLVVTLQGELTMDAGGLFQKSKFAQELMRTALDEADLITSCSGKTLADAEEFYGRSLADRSQVVFNAASVEDFEDTEPYRHSKPYIFAVGRVVPQKGFDILIKAFAGAGKSDHDLLIAGDGPERASLEQQARESGVGQRVHFLGRADRKTVAALFRGASFFVLPSRADEGLPVVCSEAMAAGKAVLATRSGGVPEAVIHGETGLVVDRGDVEGLARGLELLSCDAPLRDKLAASGKNRSRLFSWPVITEQYLEVYRHALQRSGQTFPAGPAQATRGRVVGEVNAEEAANP